MPIQHRNVYVGLPYSSYDHFNIFDMRDVECEVEFCFKKESIYRLAAALQVPGTFKCQNGVVIYTIEGLCVLLKRFAFHAGMLILYLVVVGLYPSSTWLNILLYTTFLKGLATCTPGLNSLGYLKSV